MDQNDEEEIKKFREPGNLHPDTYTSPQYTSPAIYKPDYSFENPDTAP